MRARVFGLAALLLLTGCVSRPAPEPAVMRETAPPWDAPRDAVSYIRASGLPEVPLDSRDDPWIVRLRLEVDGAPVELAPYIGVDRLRAVQAPVHTHDSTGDVWLEGEGNREATLGQFFTLWGVRLDDSCLGNACRDLTVTADGQRVTMVRDLPLRGVRELTVSVHSG